MFCSVFVLSFMFFQTRGVWEMYIYIFVVGGGDGLLLRFSLHFSRLIFGLLFGSFLKYTPARFSLLINIEGDNFFKDRI